MGPASAPYRFARGFSSTTTLSATARFAYIDRMAVWLRRASSERPRALYQDKRHSRNCPLAWAPDGQALFHSHDQIVRIDPRSAKPRPVTNFRSSVRSGAYWQLQCSPDGATLVFRYAAPSRSKEKVGVTSICAVPATGGRHRSLFKPSRASKARLWSFEVNWRRGVIIADTYGPSGWTLWRMDLRGKGARIIRGGDDVQDFAVSPDGTRVACEHRGGIWLLDIDRPVMRPLLAKGRQPAWSPDGKRIAFMDSGATLGVIDVTSRKQSRLVWGEGPRAARYNDGWVQAPSWSPDGRLLWFTVTASKEAHIAQGTIDHRVGIVDFAEKEVWMRSGYWTNVSWAPQPSAKLAT